MEVRTHKEFRMTQLQFDSKAATTARDRALKTVEQNADKTWKERALDAVESCALRYDLFIVDQVWQQLKKGDTPGNDNRAMGAVIRRAIKAGFIEATETYRPSDRVTSHKVPRRVWKSLLRRNA